MQRKGINDKATLISENDATGPRTQGENWL